MPRLSLWFFHSSVAVIVFLYRCHWQSPQINGSERIESHSSEITLADTFRCFSFIAVLPLFCPHQPLYFLAIVASVLTIVVMIEAFGKIGTVRVNLESERDSDGKLTRSHSKLALLKASAQTLTPVRRMQ